MKIFDRRLEEEDAVVSTFSGHQSWVQNIRYHPTREGQYISARWAFFRAAVWLMLIHLGSLDGTAMLWDLRYPDEALKTWDLHPSGLSSFDVHGQAGVLASWVHTIILSYHRLISLAGRPL